MQYFFPAIEEERQVDLRSMIRELPDFPKPGISFKDISTLLKDGKALDYATSALADPFRDKEIELVVAVEARGFAIGAPVACKLGAGFVLVRKPGKLPADTLRYEYELEYGTDTLEIHKDAISPGQKVLIVDDVLATGGTVSAAIRMVEQLGGDIQGLAFLIELEDLAGRSRLAKYDVLSLVKYND